MSKDNCCSSSLEPQSCHSVAQIKFPLVKGVKGSIWCDVKHILESLFFNVDSINQETYFKDTSKRIRKLHEGLQQRSCNSTQQLHLDTVPFVMSQIAEFPGFACITEQWVWTKEAQEQLGGVLLTTWQPKWLPGSAGGFSVTWTPVVTSARSRWTFRSCERCFTASLVAAVCSWHRHNWPVRLMSASMCAPFHSLTPSEPWPDEMFSHKARLHRWMGRGRLRWVWLTLGSRGHNGGRSF